MASNHSLRPPAAQTTLAALTTLIGGELVASDDLQPQILVSGVSVDSQDIEPGWVFVAIPGFQKHGAIYASGALTRGAIAVVTDQAGSIILSEAGLNVATVIVDNPRRSAALLAKALYEPIFEGITAVGVTGTNGKTTSTYYLRQALQPVFGKVGLCGTLEIDVDGDPIPAERTTSEAPVIYRILATAATAGKQAMVVESSAHAVSLYRLEGLRFDLVSFTNLQHDHLDYYGDMETYFQAKAALFTPDRAGCGVICVDDEWGVKLWKQSTIDCWTFGFTSAHKAQVEANSHWQIENVVNSEKRAGSEFELVAPDGQRQECFSPLAGKVNVQDAALAIVCAVRLGVDLLAAAEAVAITPPIPGRMQMVPRPNDQEPRIMVDYAHTPEALEALLATAHSITSGKVNLVFGTDGERDPSKREGLGEVAARCADSLWVTDENPRFEDPQEIRDYLLRGVKKVRPDFKDAVEITTCRRDAVRKAILSSGPNDIVIMSGKGPETYQDIEGVKHDYDDRQVAWEVMNSGARKRQPR